MGSGKSTVGAIVADALGCPFLDLDLIVEKKAGKNIPEIFAAEGEAAFREKEKIALEETLKKYGGATAVLALGGGTPTLPGATGLIRTKSLCIYLKTSLEELQRRLEGEKEGRPLSGEGLAERLAARESLYNEAAEVVIETDGLSPEQIADEIIISCL